MADQRQPRRGKGNPQIAPHPLVEALIPDPGQPPQKTTQLFGYPGASTDAGSTRLYLDLELTSYVDIPTDAIQHSQTLENDQGTIVWVDPSATLRYSSTQSHEVQADFLTGGIQEQHLDASRATLASGAAGQAGLLVTASGACHTIGFACVPSRLSPCSHTPLCGIAVTRVPPCGILTRSGASVCFRCVYTWQPGCTIGIACVPSKLQPCATGAPVWCPSEVMLCGQTQICENFWVRSEACGPMGGPIDPIG
jgi:hypothetical protein